jgi:hypothetical protein
VCQLTVLGSSLAADVAPSGPLNFISNAVVGAADLMSTLPVQGDVYYLVGAPPAHMHALPLSKSRCRSCARGTCSLVRRVTDD